MRLAKLSAKQHDIVLRCMKATAAYLDDWEKHLRLGLEASELDQEIERWPDIDNSQVDSNGFLALNNCMNEVCYGFRISPEDWGRWFDTPISEVESTYRNWLELTGTRGGIR